MTKLPCRIAIHPDKVIQKNGEVQSFSDRWIELASIAGIEVRKVDVFSSAFFNRLAGCDAFMWRFDYAASSRLFAKRLLPAIEQGLNIPVFPSWKTVWHFEDKVAQHYLLQAAGIPQPKTWVFWRRNAAEEFCSSATYPLVMKLSYGFQSANVKLLQTANEAMYWIEQMFTYGVTSLRQTPALSKIDNLVYRLRSAVRQLRARSLYANLSSCELQHGYFYVQEFLRGNEFDTRITIIGNRAFAFRRFNRVDDFRASGSGRIDWDPAKIDSDSIRLAFTVAQRLETQSIGVDILLDGTRRVLSEISYTYAAWAVRECPGHWRLVGDAMDGELVWHFGKVRPEDAIFQDFVGRAASMA